MSRLFLACSLIAAAASCSYLASRKVAAPGPRVERDHIVFRFYAPSAGRVQIGGDWPENNWTRGDGSAGEANIGLMSDDDGDGVWEISLRLPPGRYLYLFLVDENQWFTDPGNNEEVEGGPQGRCSRISIFERNGVLQIR